MHIHIKYVMPFTIYVTWRLNFGGQYGCGIYLYNFHNTSWETILIPWLIHTERHYITLSGQKESIQHKYMKITLLFHYIMSTSALYELVRAYWKEGIVSLGT